MESGVAVAGVEHSVIFEGQQVCVLPPGHALARRKVIKPADLAGQPFIRLADGDPQRISIDAAFAAAGVSYRPILQTRQLRRCLCDGGAGPRRYRGQSAHGMAGAGPGLVIRRFAPAIPYAVLLALPRYRPPSAAVSAFADAVRRSGKQLAKALAAALKPSFTMDRYEP
jgi:DNA-binding transcriptional LysR family regulator